MTPDELTTVTTSRDNETVFWFTPATHSAHMQLNKQATELLLMTTGFTARQVPLLRGNIVITGHDGLGNPAGLTTQQESRLINAEPTGRQEWILGWRFSCDARARRRASRSAEATRLAACHGPNPTETIDARRAHRAVPWARVHRRPGSMTAPLCC